ncbi:hypothetical protein F5X96DRAFT_666584 [Biscogniauxia mediterranea]|nr:hypothetical protein F5X96DRAFT_666584 [Biscogniauxia mediterranea]
MDSGTYNNVRRDTNPLSPMTPATPGVTSYKTNVNRTKTRKWVEAKVQSYDGDDWGNEYDDDPYDEPEEPQPPKMAGTGRGQLAQSSRTFSQPVAPTPAAAPTIPPYKAAIAALRKTSGPPSLHVQTQPTSSAPNPRFGSDQAQKPGGAYAGRPEYQSTGNSGLLASRFPPRQSSMGQQSQLGQQGSSGAGNAAVAGSGSLGPNPDARPGIDQRSASPGQAVDTSGKALPMLRPSDIYGRTSEEKEDTRQIPATLEPDPEKKGGIGEDRRLSVSPQLPDLVRMSGFGDDFFSMGPRYSSTQPTPTLASISDDRPHETGSTDAGSSEKTPQASSTIEGPKLQPNPDIIMPRANEVASKAAAAPQQPTVRPQIPGSWVSESTNAGTEQQQLATPMQSPGVAGATPSPAAAEADRAATPTNTNNDNTDINNNTTTMNLDMEPTTQIKHLPSSDQSLTTMAKIQSDFGRPTGQHDDAVASAVISAGPGFHPTPPSLPPLKTDNPLARALPAQPTTHTSASSEFAPTAPLKTHRSSIYPQSDVAVLSANDQTPTISSAGTGSPQKESDKLREEIIKSLEPAAASDADGAISHSPTGNGREPAPGALSRESTYLSDVYDDYLLAGEEKSLQETGDELKKEYMMAANQSPGARNTGHPLVADIAPLSPQRGPKSGSPDRPRRFSWEQSLEQVGMGPVDTKSPVLAISPSPYSTDTHKIVSPKTDAVPSGFEALHAHPPFGDGHASRRVSQVSSRGPDDAGMPLEPPSPLSNVASRSPRTAPDGSARESQLSLAEEKEQGLTDRLGSSSPEQHPALAARESLSSDVAPLSRISHDAAVPGTAGSQQPKVLTFREILSIASTEHRIQTFEETRDQFTAMESGLANWLVFMQNQAEKHDGDELGGMLLLSPTQQHSPTTAQQQGWNGNSGNPNAIGRTPSGAGGQGFGASGAGTKSKELLHTAGQFGNKGIKTGMKLFNKGRSKLRERAAASSSQGEKQQFF